MGLQENQKQTQVALIYTLSTSCTGRVKRGVHAVYLCKREKDSKAKVCVVRNKRSGHQYEDGGSLNYTKKLYLPRLASQLLAGSLLSREAAVGREAGLIYSSIPRSSTSYN